LVEVRQQALLDLLVVARTAEDLHQHVSRLVSHQEARSQRFDHVRRLHPVDTRLLDLAGRQVLLEDVVEGGHHHVALGGPARVDRSRRQPGAASNGTDAGRVESVLHELLGRGL